MAGVTLSKRVRFGVFKRDSFACQYCGAAAPNVQLHVDHIVPVSEGGSDDPSNLVTACAACNFGKGAINLNESDLAALDTTRGAAEMDERRPDDGQGDPQYPAADGTLSEDFIDARDHAQALAERRTQLEMMIEWREEVIGLQDEAIDALDRRIVERTGLSMSEEYRQRMRRWVRRHGLAVIFEALEDALDQMLEWQDGVVTLASWERALSAIPQVAELGQVARDKPHFRELVYICGLLRRRLPYFNELRCLRLMEDGVQAGASIEAMKAFARTVKSWTAFRRGIEEYIKDYAVDGELPRGDERPRVAEATEAGEDEAALPEGPLRPPPSAMPEAPFSKTRPLRHFVAEAPVDGADYGGREIDGADTGYRYDERAARTGKHGRRRMKR